MARFKKCCGGLIRYCRMPNGHWLWMNADGSGRHDCLGAHAAAASVATYSVPTTSPHRESSNPAGPYVTAAQDSERPWLNFLALLAILALFVKLIVWLWSALVWLFHTVVSYWL